MYNGEVEMEHYQLIQGWTKPSPAAYEMSKREFTAPKCMRMRHVLSEKLNELQVCFLFC